MARHTTGVMSRMKGLMHRFSSLRSQVRTWTRFYLPSLPICPILETLLETPHIQEALPPFTPETQFIQVLPNPTHTGPTRLLAPVSAMGPNRQNSGQTIFGMFTFSRPETRVTPSARPGSLRVSMPSTMGNAASTSGFTNPFTWPELQHSIPSTSAHQWGSGQPSVAHPGFVNTGGVSFSGPNTAEQWTVPSNHALNIQINPPQLLTFLIAPELDNPLPDESRNFAWPLQLLLVRVHLPWGLPWLMYHRLLLPVGLRVEGLRSPRNQKTQDFLL